MSVISCHTLRQGYSSSISIRQMEVQSVWPLQHLYKPSALSLDGISMPLSSKLGGMSPNLTDLLFCVLPCTCGGLVWVVKPLYGSVQCIDCVASLLF